MTSALAVRPSGRYLLDDLPVLGGVMVLCGIYLAGLSALGIGLPSLAAYASYAQLYVWGLALLVIGRAVAIMVRRPDRPLTDFARELIARVPRIVAAAPILVALILFMSLFGLVKEHIAAINPYAWDAEFVSWDRTLFFTDPWRIMQPLLGFPVVTSVIGLLYKLWLGLIFAGSWFFAAYVDDRRLRTRYLISYFMIWSLIGSVLAVALSSVGPVFLEPIMGNAHFAEQTRYLAEANAKVPNISFAAQQYLLERYLSSETGLGVGISAMPSMHVALATLVMLAARRHSRAGGWFFAAFLLVIAVGSVHLAYHYAVDGIISGIITVIVWKVAGPVSDLVLRFRAADREPLAA